ncbi:MULTISPECIES: 7-carboxy-7-deazaguanine synthase [Thiomicrorhabdus]|uniref:7-carboxy-7-deazaguanine synthase n=1 Tax=Thiomicrorhabdus heinhorstiae TaxID=2748010 RepID=A0ABS0BWG1_9GAMM|nr:MULTISPECIES: 7-carboxy-7-deazaguanine synthase [Thiomicrorhabdus]MBF6057314.1 7-carboxy-7-deazaguanine synthase [Thiomicrorhabdus heinhorstiae]
MSYSVKEVFYSLQGEGFHSGRPAIFCRLTQCNLWTGREQDRAKAICQFCDTDFIGTDGQNGGKFADAAALSKHLLNFWPDKNVVPFVVLTGGEPLLQVDQALIDTLHEFGFEIAIETNGTKQAPQQIDWICVSPKANAPLLLDHGNELKLVYPQAELLPEKVADLPFEHFYLQPMDDADPQIQTANIRAAVEYCLAHPQWQLSLQTHKLLGID